MGATAWLRFGSNLGSELRYAPIWALHGLGAPPSLDSLIDSAKDALSRAKRGGIIPIVGGIVLQALTSPTKAVQWIDKDPVHGVLFGPGDQQLSRGLEAIENVIERVARRML
jgi:hypothetical protein